MSNLRISTLVCVIILTLIGCSKPANVIKLTPVKMDETAAFPSQEPGTRPPILSGFTPLTRQLLDEGWVQLFDGVSSYGWEVVEGEGQIIVLKGSNGKTYFRYDGKDDKYLIQHRFVRALLESNSQGGVTFSSRGHGWANHFEASSNLNLNLGDIGNKETFSIEGSNAIRSKPNDLKPLGEDAWKPASGAAKAVWEDGVMELTGGSGMVESVDEYENFVLQLEYFTEKGINSGVFFRCIPGENMNGYECQIFNEPPAGDYEKFIGTDTGGIFRRQVGRNVGPQDGQWNYLTVAVNGPDVATWVNGIQTTDWTDTRDEHVNPRNGKRLKAGTIQFQGHDPTTKIKFRNMKIAVLE